MINKTIPIANCINIFVTILASALYGVFITAITPITGFKIAITVVTAITALYS